MTRVRAALAATLAALALAGDEARPPTARDIALASAVDLRVTGCGLADGRGAGAVIAGGYILTVAHVVAGATKITVTPASHPGSAGMEASIVALDPVNDLALLTAPGMALPQLRLGVAGEADRGVAVLFRERQPLVQSFTVTKPVVVRILDIFHENTISRPGLIVAIDIAPGDSGAILVSANTSAIGVLYATSRELDNRAFATDMSAVRALVDLASGPAAGPGVGAPITGCVS